MTAMDNTFPAVMVLLLEALQENPQTAVVCLLVFAAALIDFMSHRVPNRLTVSGLAFALVLQFACLGWSGLLDGFGGFFIGLCIYLPLYAAGWMGAGDVKLMAAAGAFLGLSPTLLAVCLSTTVGVIISLMLIGWRGGLGEYLSRYGLMFKCLVFTGQLAYVGPPAGSAATTRFPYAFAIFLGTLATLWRFGRFDPFLGIFGT